MMRLSVQKSIRDRGYMTISLLVLDQNDRAESFYKINGFKADGDVKNSGLWDKKEERYICELDKSAMCNQN